MERKKETFIFEGLGFPIELIDAPMKKVLGEWVIDINMGALQRFVFRGLIHKPYPLTGKEIKFMRKFLSLSTKELGKKLGVTHAAIVKWEKEQSRISPAQEPYLRMVFLECLMDSELIKLYQEIRPEKLAEAKNEKHPPFQVNSKELQAANF